MKDQTRLRELAKRYLAYTQRPQEQEKSNLWTQKNALRKTRPLILCTLPAEAWEELVDDSMCTIADPFLRTYELYLLRQLYRAEHLPDDEVLLPDLYTPLVYSFSDWLPDRKRPYSGSCFRAECFHPSIVEYGDLGKLQQPKLIEIDEKQADAYYDQLSDAIGDILPVHRGKPTTSDTDSYVKGWGYSVIDVLCELRGMQNIYLDMALNPQFVHDAMAFLTQGIAHYQQEMQQNHLLRLNNNGYVMSANTPLGSNGLAITNALPAPDFDPAHVRYQDLWGYAMAQEFSEVSPQMHAEFVLPYQQRLLRDFGLVSYGCCEANDKKWAQIFAAFPNLREVSVSHCANLEIAAEQLQDRYVFSWKPNCSVIATFDEDAIRKQLSHGMQVARDCHLIVCLRDNITLFGAPERVERWIQIAQQLAHQS